MPDENDAKSPPPPPPPKDEPLSWLEDISKGIASEEITQTAPEQGPPPDTSPSDSGGGEGSASEE